MKKLFILTFFIGFCLFVAMAQNHQIEKDIRHLLEVNGSNEQFEMVSQQLVNQFKMQNSGVEDSVWASVKEDVIQPAFKELNEKMVPMYKKHFTRDEIKDLIVFYESETGKMLVKTQPLIQQEIMPYSQKWGQQLATDIQMKISGY